MCSRISKIAPRRRLAWQAAHRFPLCAGSSSRSGTLAFSLHTSAHHITYAPHAPHHGIFSPPHFACTAQHNAMYGTRRRVTLFCSVCSGTLWAAGMPCIRHRRALGTSILYKTASNARSPASAMAGALYQNNAMVCIAMFPRPARLPSARWMAAAV